MRRLILFLLLQLYGYFSVAQTSAFFKQYNFTIRYIEEVNSSYYVAGNDSYGAIFLQTDLAGNLIWAREYQAQGFFMSAVKYVPGQGFALAVKNDTTGAIGLLFTDMSGNILWAKQYDLPGNSNITVTLDIPSPGGFILAGSYSTQNYVISADSTGNPTWAKSYSDANNSQGAVSDLFCDPLDGSILVSMWTSSVSSVGCKISASGNLVWAKSGVGGNFLAREQDGYVVSWFTNWYAMSHQGGALEIGRYDTLGNRKKLLVAWGPTAWFYDVKATSSGYVAAGYYTDTAQNNSRPLLVEVDTAFNVIWSRKYGDVLPVGTFPANWSVNGTSDGGYISGGTYLFKTDSSGATGCKDTLVQLYDGIIYDTTEVLPAITSLAENPLAVTAAALTVQLSIPVIADAVYCFTGIGETVFKEQDVMIRPNPNYGSFTVSFQDTAVQSAMLNIYNVLGNAVRTVYVNSSTQVEITGLSAGVYFVCIENANGNRAVKKVIVQ